MQYCMKMERLSNPECPAKIQVFLINAEKIFSVKKRPKFFLDQRRRYFPLKCLSLVINMRFQSSVKITRNRVLKIWLQTLVLSQQHTRSISLFLSLKHTRLDTKTHTHLKTHIHVRAKPYKGKYTEAKQYSFCNLYMRL